MRRDHAWIEPENDILARRPGPVSRISEPVTGRQERSNSSTRSHDPITDIWKEIRHDYLEETRAVVICALPDLCLGIISGGLVSTRHLLESSLSPGTPGAFFSRQITTIFSPHRGL